MLQLLRISISKKVTLKTDLSENLSAVLANPAQIRQVVMNLITNASEAIGEKGGVITIATSEVQAGDGSADRFQGLRGGGVRLEVSDTGCGMAEETRSNIFDPFFTTKFAGRGLGLAAVHGIIQNHGGVINVASAPGHGSRFEILMPSAGEPVRDPGNSSIPAAEEAGSFAGNILVVEDEEALRSAVSKMLRRKGCTVIEAADGQAGIDRFRANEKSIELVLLDLTLPGISGGEVLHELRRIRPNLKVIVTSAYSRGWAQDSVGGQQPWFYIRKPYQFSQLTVLIRDVCLDQMKYGHAEG
jgi:CheY-like chemotaxis protein